jgi:hypothetical protein
MLHRVRLVVLGILSTCVAALCASSCHSVESDDV